jgi:MFS family permease
MNLFLLWLLYVAFGLISRSVAPLVTPILKDLQLSYTQMGFILGSWQLTYIVVAILAGTLIDKWGVRKSLMAGAIVIGLSSVLRYFPKGFEGMLGAVALFGAGFHDFIGIPKAIFIVQRKNGGRPWVSPTGSGSEGFVLTRSLIMPLMGHSWRYTLALYGFLTLPCFVVVFAGTLTVRREKQVS